MPFASASAHARACLSAASAAATSARSCATAHCAAAAWITHPAAGWSRAGSGKCRTQLVLVELVPSSAATWQLRCLDHRWVGGWVVARQGAGVGVTAVEVVAAGGDAQRPCICCVADCCCCCMHAASTACAALRLPHAMFLVCRASEHALGHAALLDMACNGRSARNCGPICQLACHACPAHCWPGMPLYRWMDC